MSELTEADHEHYYNSVAGQLLKEFDFHTLYEAGRNLQRKATELFRLHGPHDPRGAAFWDAGCFLIGDFGRCPTD